MKGASLASLDGNFKSGKEQLVRVEFPASLLKSGYNEISLRSTQGSWLVFDALALETPVGARLAPVVNPVIRAVTIAPYAVSADPPKPATILVEVFQANGPGKLKIEVEHGGSEELATDPGVKVLEIPVHVSTSENGTAVRLSTGTQVLYETRLNLVASPPVTPADYVNVFQGTAHSRWMIAPGPWMPFGMVKISPDNQEQGWASGYDYGVESIDCFSHLHEWPMAGLGMMPTKGPLRTRPGLSGRGYTSRIDNKTALGGIGFYEVMLEDTGIKVELTATTRASLQHYTFPASDEARVIFDFLLPQECGTHVLGAKVRRVSPTEIEGTIQTLSSHLWNYPGEQRYDLHFVAQFDRPFDDLGGWHDYEGFSNVQTLDFSGDCGAFVDFKTAAGEQIQVRAGISLVSVANARLNLEKELAQPFGWDFDAVVRNQRQVWNELFNRVQIETSDQREKSRFYSNLYRTLSGRNTASDINGEWTDPEERTQKLSDPNAVMLSCDAFWNTFWNLNQVMNLLTPEWSARWVKSELALYDKGGWLSKGPTGLEYISVMMAEHEIALLVAAHQHGVKGVDAKKVLEAAIKMQTTPPQKHPGGGAVGNDNLENYLSHGYVASDGGPPGQNPTDIHDNAHHNVSNTFEYAYDDWCVAQLALALGSKEVAEPFLKRSQSWRNALDMETGFARPRKVSGEWLTPFDPYHTPGFVEGNAWQYTWFVPQDVPGLVATLGQKRFISRLNKAFELSAPAHFSAGDMVSTPINHGNQPSMHTAWLFNWADRPWLTQNWVRSILDAFYGHNPADAYLGDEDQGQMSGWFVMASLGLFQTDGGCRVDPIYELGSPLYPKITLHLSPEHYGGKTFVIEARNTSRTNRYIQSATLNGKPLNQWWIRQKDIIAGGSLVFEMGSEPNESWAKGCPLP